MHAHRSDHPSTRGMSLHCRLNHHHPHHQVSSKYMQSSSSFPLSQGTRIIDALDTVEHEISMLVDPDSPLLSQRSDQHRHDIFQQAHVRLQDILSLVPGAAATPPPSPTHLHPTPSPRSPRTGPSNDHPPATQTAMIADPRWERIAAAVSSRRPIDASQFTIRTFLPLLQRQTVQTIEDEALMRLMCGYSDDDASWLSCLGDMKSPYHSNVLDLYSQLNAQENRDLIYCQFLTAQHRDKIHNLVFHVVSFIKRHELLLAFKICEADTRRGSARQDYAEDIFSRRYKHLLDRLTHHRTPVAEQQQLKKQLAQLKRTLNKRFKQSLERADLLAQLYDSFGAAILLDSFWHFDWLEDIPSFSKGFQTVVLQACHNTTLTSEGHAQSVRALHHVMSVLGDEDGRDIIHEWLQNHEPLALTS